MDVTIMPSTTQLFNTIISSFPSINFVSSDDFRWNPKKKNIEYDLNDSNLTERLLHEIAHAQLGHETYRRDIDLIALERDAWHYAKTVLAPKFNTAVNTAAIDNDMDTYRDWLHARSTCPNCQATGLQTDERIYTCVSCLQTWRVNNAIGCSLKRYMKDTPTKSASLS